MTYLKCLSQNIILREAVNDGVSYITNDVNFWIFFLGENAEIICLILVNHKKSILPILL